VGEKIITRILDLLDARDARALSQTSSELKAISDWYESTMLQPSVHLRPQPSSLNVTGITTSLPAPPSPYYGLSQPPSPQWPIFSLFGDPTRGSSTSSSAGSIYNQLPSTPIPGLGPIMHLMASLSVQPTTTTNNMLPPSTPSFSRSTSSPASNAADYDTLASTDTEMSEIGDSEQDGFEVTPDIKAKVNKPRNRAATPTLHGMPNELTLQIFGYLDEIDSVCLGLTSRNAYLIYREIHGTKMPLNTRRIGPNTLESAWEVVGKQSCKQCGPYRCELYQHIKTWMPEELEYCTMKQNFGRKANPSAKETCVRGKPSKPKRCGRHPERTTSMHQDDNSFAMTASL